MRRRPAGGYLPRVPRRAGRLVWVRMVVQICPGMQRHVTHWVRRVVRLALARLLRLAGMQVLPGMQRHTLMRQTAHHALGGQLMRRLGRLERGRRCVGHILILGLLPPLLLLLVASWQACYRRVQSCWRSRHCSRGRCHRCHPQLRGLRRQQRGRAVAAAGEAGIAEVAPQRLGAGRAPAEQIRHA